MSHECINTNSLVRFFLASAILISAFLLNFMGCKLPLVGRDKGKSGSGGLKITLTDERSKTPLVDAEVNLLPEGGKEISNNKGEVFFKSVRLDTYNLSITKPGYMEKSQEKVIIVADSIISENIELIPTISEFVITPKDPDMLEIGKVMSLKAEVVYHGGYKDSEVTWFTSDSGIAIVDDKGVVTGVSGGYAQITARSKSDVTLSQYVLVTVLGVTNLSFPVSSFTLWKNETQKIPLAVVTYNDQSSNNKVKYTLLDTGIIKVAESENSIEIKALNPGKTTIIAKAEKDTASFTKISITVLGVDYVKISQDSTVLKPGDGLDLKATAYYSDGNLDGNVKWSNTNPAVIEQDSAGIWRPIKPGTAQIFAISARDRSKSAHCKVNVLGVKHVKLYTPHLTIFRGDTATIGAYVEYTDKSIDEKINLVLSQKDLIDTSAWPVITGLKAGKLKLTAIASRDTAQRANIEIEVVDVDSIIVSTDYLLIKAGDSVKANASVYYSDGNNSTSGLEWSSASNNTALIDSMGNVLAVKPGETRITVHNPVNPGLSRHIFVRVIQPVGAFGTGNIDGDLDSLEWQKAESRDYPFTLRDSTGNDTAKMMLLVMNDLTNLSFGIKIPCEDSSLRPQIAIRFNNDGDREDKEQGDDVILFDTSGFIDGHLIQKQDSVFIMADTISPGSNDGSGVAGFDSAFQYIEISHPLNSPDNYDFHLSTGNFIGFHMSARLIRNDSIIGYGGSPDSVATEYIEILPGLK